MPRRRKKSIYKSAIINKKRYYFYSIKWVDITGDAAHATVDEFDRFMPVSYTHLTLPTKA